MISCQRDFGCCSVWVLHTFWFFGCDAFMCFQDMTVNWWATAILKEEFRNTGIRTLKLSCSLRGYKAIIRVEIGISLLCHINSCLLIKIVGMHGIGFFGWYLICQYLATHLADNRYRYWYIYIYVYFFLTPIFRDHQVSSVVKFTYSIIIPTFNVLACQQMQA